MIESANAQFLGAGNLGFSSPIFFFVCFLGDFLASLLCKDFPVPFYFERFPLFFVRNFRGSAEFSEKSLLFVGFPCFLWVFLVTLAPKKQRKIRDFTRKLP